MNSIPDKSLWNTLSYIECLQPSESSEELPLGTSLSSTHAKDALESPTQRSYTRSVLSKLTLHQQTNGTAFVLLLSLYLLETEL